MRNNFGKLVSYEQNGNEVIIQFEQKTAYVTVIREEIVRIFVPYFLENYQSKAIEGEKIVPTNFQAVLENGILTITTEKVVAKIADDFIVDFYRRNML